MKKLKTLSALAALIALVGAAPPECFAGTVSFDLATGQNPAGTISTTADTQDVNWTITSVGTSTPQNFPNTYVVGPTSADWGGGYTGGWLANGPNSSWIAPNPNNANLNGDYIVSYSFNISGTPTAASCSGCQWTIDDGGQVSLNGNLLSTLSSGNWAALNTFSIPLADLVSGTNTLSIGSQNSNQVIEGVRMEGTLNVTAVPLPASVWLMLSGLVGVAVMARKRRAA